MWGWGGDGWVWWGTVGGLWVGSFNFFSFFLHFDFTTELVTMRCNTAVRTSKSEHDMHTHPLK